MKELSIYLGYSMAWKAIRLLPEKFAYSVFALIGKRVHRRNGRLVQRLRSNLARVMPLYDSHELEKLVRESFQSYMRYWCDTFRSPDWTPERIKSTVTCTDDHLLIDPMRSGKGVIVALPHAGNWDHAGAYFCGMGFPLVTVAEKLKPEKLFRRFLRFRAAIGMEVLPLDSRAMGKLLQRAREGKLVALVADRDLSQSGIEVDFFGAKAKMPAGPALLAIRTGVPLIGAYVSYRKNGIHIDFAPIEISMKSSDEENISSTTQNVARFFEENISKYPQDWHMLQRIWFDEK